MPEAKATLRYSGTSPTKVRQVLNLIRGKDVLSAREILRFCERGAADEVAKLLDSAVANAEHNEHLPTEELFIARCWADEGPTQKRYRPRARGRATRIRKRMSHVTVVVARYSEEDLIRRSIRDETTRGVDDRRRRALRRRRVAASTAVAEGTEAHDHDHDHDDVPVDEVAVDEVADVEEDVDEQADVEETVDTPEASADEAAEEAGAEEADADEADGDEDHAEKAD